MSVAVTTERIKVGDRFTQISQRRDGKPLTRVIEVTGRPTPSSPVNYRILRNDAHPHRVGKHGSIRKADLARKYRAA